MMKLLRQFQEYIGDQKILLPLSLLISAISTLIGLLPFIFIWLIIQELFNNGLNFSKGLMINYAWWSLGSAITSLLLYFLALTLSHLAAFKVETAMRRRAMKKIIHFPLGFFDHNTSGRIRKIIDDNASITHSFLAHQMPDLAATIITPLTLLICIFIFNWKLGIATLIPILFAFTTIKFMTGSKGKEFMKNYMTALEEMNTEAVEYVRGIPVVKVFQQTVYSFKSFHKSIMKYKEMVFAYTKIWEKPMSFYTVIINSFAFILIPIAILMIYSGDAPKTVILNLFLYLLITPLFSLSIMRSMHLGQAKGQAEEAFNRIKELTEIPSLSTPDNPIKVEQYNITFQNVSFQYPNTNRKTIKQISFTVPENSTTALVGSSGSGKTTIARLLPRFWDIDSGKILIGNVDIKEINHKELMSIISFVFQNTKLFKMTIRDNVKYGTSSATDDEIFRALKMAQCDNIIASLPKGIDTKIGSEGTYLSGGEQQRIILARAILKNAPIIILDEATAFSDPENEYLIQKALKTLTRGKTVLMIAHRLSSVKDADQILVIKDGEIEEQEKHQNLLNQKGLYHTMWLEYQRSVQWTVKKEI